MVFRIVFYFFLVIDYGNIIFDFLQLCIVRELGLNKLNVLCVFKELFERKILICNVEDGQVYLNFNLCVKGIFYCFNEDLMDKFSKFRFEIEDFVILFNFYCVGCKIKFVKKFRNRYLIDGIFF